MDFAQALDALTRGESVTHNGKTFRLLARGIHDVTDSENPVHVHLTAEDWDGAAPEAVPEVVAPETVDETLNEEPL